MLPGFLRLNGRRRNHVARASGPPEAGPRAGLARVRSSLARSARRRRLKPPGTRLGAAGPHGTPLTPAVGAGPLGAARAAGYGLAVSGFNDQMRGLYRNVRLSLAVTLLSGLFRRLRASRTPIRPARGQRSGRVAERGRAGMVERLT